jgi:eukaryotic-like serine/threonine-protein kinase
MEPGPDPLIGKTIQERYRVERKLGQGGMGAVYLAEHVLIQKRVAIKCLHAGLASNPEVVRRFHNEALAATAIGHPNIVDVTDMGYFEDGSIFMVLEFLEGKDWQDDLETSGPQSAVKVAHVGIQVCEALAAAGEKGIVHRDLKPENIFLIERQGDPLFVKVLDFGISKFKDGLTGSTRTGALMGTPYYMAPEQIHGARETNHLADLYSTGVMFYRALAGALPFEAQTLPELVLKVATQLPPSLGVRRPDLPARLIDLIDRMLRKDPLERPPNFDTVADVLADFDDTALRRKRHRVAVSLLVTGYGGSIGEPALGEAPPDRVRHPTPVHERGPDTSAQGSPVAYIASVRPEPPAAGLPSLPAPLPPEARVSTPPLVTLGPAAGSSLPAPGSFLPSHVPGVPRTRSSLWASILAVFVALVAVLGLWGGSLLSAPERPSSARTLVPTSNKVRVQISTLPPDADLFLDGSPLTNPFDGELPKDGKRHQLLTSRTGFDSSARSLVLSSEQRVFVQLSPATKSEPAPLEAPALARAGAATVSPSPSGKKRTPSVEAQAPSTPKPESARPEPVKPTAAVEKAPDPAPPASPSPPKSPLKKVF